jgi:transposase
MKESSYSSIDTRTRACKAVRDGMSQSQVAKTFGVNRSTVSRWCKRYDKRKKDDGLSRLNGSGRPPVISDQQMKQIKSIVLSPATGYGFDTDFWTCRRITQVIKKELKVKTSIPTTWRWLRDLNLTYQAPERFYVQASQKARKDWIKNTIPLIKETARKHNAIIYFQDESNISLTPVLAKTWSPIGKTPKRFVTGSRGGISAMSAISGSGHLLFTLHDKRITSKEVIAFLMEMLEHHKNRHLVVIMDNAPCHKSKVMLKFIESEKRLHVFNTPTYCPDLNADEKVWQYLKHESLKDHQARTKEELKKLWLDPVKKYL